MSELNAQRIRSAVTVSLVEQARGGPFVYWHDLPAAIEKATGLGFDAVEIFAAGPEQVDQSALRRALAAAGIAVAAVGTGAGWVVQKLSLTSGDESVRRRAREFVAGIIDFAGEFGAPGIIGSMQGRHGEGNPGVTREQAFDWLIEALDELGERAARHGVPLLYEPLNRYETNMVNTVDAGVALIERLKTSNVKLLCDLFHMNIEEVDIAASLRRGGRHIGHIHFVDSNRRPAGCGHLDYTPIAIALRDIGFTGYASAEALPWPDSDEAARKTIEMFRGVFRGGNDE